MSLGLAVELCLLLAFTLGWEVSDARPGPAAKTVLLAVAGTAMGLQSVTIDRLDVGNFSSTYLTSTFIRAVVGLVVGRRSEAVPRLAAVAAMVLGAAAGVLLFLHAPREVPVIVVCDVAAVTVAGSVLARRGGPLARPSEPGGG